MRRRGSHGWREISAGDKRVLIDAIASGRAPKGPLHLELDISDRCNVDCYFCNAMDVRTKEQVPQKRVAEILDEAVANGLRSVRFAGGGDPLFHREIERVIDDVHSRGIVIDNITTNGLGMTRGVAERIVAGETREILISLNASDANDYARMMQVKPAIFDRILANIRELVALRGDRERPCLVIQFLFDQQNYTTMRRAYDLGRDLGADVIAMNLVLEIPRKRVDPKLVFHAGDTELLRPHLREVIEADRDAKLLELCFEYESMNALVAELQRETGAEPRAPFPTAPSFADRNGGCFFGYYSGVVRGNGEMYPCCMLINPDYTPIGNVMERSLDSEWHGEGFNTLRGEMREVLLASGELEYNAEQFKTLAPQCVNQHACGLKNMYFRGDEEFYRDLGVALERARRKEITLLGNRRQIGRALRQMKRRHPMLHRAYDRVAGFSPAFRRLMKRTFRTA